MNRLWILFTALFLSTACSNKEGEVFYSAHYPVTEVDVRITLAATDVALEEEIRTRVLNEAPVTAGGCYRLDFNRFDGGLLYTQHHEGAEFVVSSFDKVPAAGELTFHFGEKSYIVTNGSYINEEGIECATFWVDLTEEFHLENESIQTVRRIEFTSHPIH
ncbi:MAG: hypothetical protein IKU77_02340 [Alistipes sp.]|nr:hypothetical protein [Alistipes sp.]